MKLLISTVMAIVFFASCADNDNGSYDANRGKDENEGTMDARGVMEENGNTTAGEVTNENRAADSTVIGGTNSSGTIQR